MATLSPRQVAIPTTSLKRSVGRSPSVRRTTGRPAASATPVSPGQSALSPSVGYFEIPSPHRRLHVETKSRLLSSLAAGWAGSLSMGIAIGYSLPASRSLGRAMGTTGEGGSGQPVFTFDLMLALGALFGALGTSFVVFLLGRRCMLALGSLGSLASWLAISRASPGSWHILVARGAQGVCAGVVSLVAPAYIAEIAMAKDRGKQCGAHQTGIAAGVLYTYVLGQFMEWSHLALCCAVPSTLTVVLLMRAVESPRWLMEQGRRTDAQTALRRLRQGASLADSEFEVIEVIYPKTPIPIVHYILAVVVIVSQQFSGIDIIVQYATGPLQVRFGSTSQEQFILLAAIQFVTTAVASQLLDLVGRVRPLAVSVTLCTGSMMVLGTIYYGASNPAYALDGSLASHLTFGSMVVFSAAFSAGLGPASWVLAVELAPLRGSGFDFGSVCAFYWASALAVVSLFATFGTDPFSVAVLSWLCGAITFMGGISTFIFAPDTAGISVESILMEGQGDRPKKKSDVNEAVSSSVTPHGGEAEVLAERKGDASHARLSAGPTTERGPAARVEAAGSALAEDEDKRHVSRALPDAMHSGVVSTSHSAVVSTPSIDRPGRGRQKQQEP